MDEAEHFLEEEELDSGIVVRRGDHLCFWHLSFQEFLAARAIAAPRNFGNKLCYLPIDSGCFHRNGTKRFYCVQECYMVRDPRKSMRWQRRYWPSTRCGLRSPRMPSSSDCLVPLSAT